MVRLFTLALATAALVCAVPLSAQTSTAATATCGLATVERTAQVIYPPIARAAHVQGTVVLMVTFAHEGTVTAIRDVAGPAMLRASAEQFVKGFRANPSEGSRECAISIEYALSPAQPHECTDADLKAPTTPPPTVQTTDPQHYSYTAQTPCTVTMY